MKSHFINHSVWIPINLNEAWDFFSNPDNLAKLTPEHYNMTIAFNREVPLSEGTEINISVKPLPFFTTGWKSILTEINPPHQFKDIQKSGPFKQWNHTHSFMAEGNGTRVTDEVEYSLPFGLLGKLAHRLIVEKQIKSLFHYREQKLRDIFGE